MSGLRNTIDSLRKHRFARASAERKPSVSGKRDYRIYRLTVSDRLRYGLFGIGLSALISRTYYRSFAVFILTAPVFAVLLPAVKQPDLKERERNRLNTQFREAIGMVSSFQSAGYSVENAFFATLSQLRKLYGEKAVITEEFEGICRSIRLNVPVEELLSDLAKRSGLQDIRNFAEVFAIARRTGGNLTSVIGRTVTVIRAKAGVAEEIRTITASRAYEQKIMNILPFAIILYLDVTSKGFLDVMYEGVAGRAVMTVCLLLTAGAYLLSSKILKIEV